MLRNLTRNGQPLSCSIGNSGSNHHLGCHFHFVFAAPAAMASPSAQHICQWKHIVFMAAVLSICGSRGAVHRAERPAASVDSRMTQSMHSPRSSGAKRAVIVPDNNKVCDALRIAHPDDRYTFQRPAKQVGFDAVLNLYLGHFDLKSGRTLIEKNALLQQCCEQAGRRARVAAPGTRGKLRPEPSPWGPPRVAGRTWHPEPRPLGVGFGARQR